MQFARKITPVLLFGALAYAQSLQPPPQDSVLRFVGNSAAYADNIPLGSSFTIEAWVRLEAPAPLAIIIGKAYSPRGVDPLMHYGLRLDETGKRIVFVQTTGQKGSGRQIAAPADTPLFTWTHLAATLDSGVMRLYVNAVEVARGASPGPPEGRDIPLGIGGGLNDDQSPSNAIKGALRQVRIWTRALSADELRRQAQSPLAGAEQGLLAAWPLDDAQGLPRSVTAGREPLRLQGWNVFWDRLALLDSGPYWSEVLLPIPTTPILLGTGAAVQTNTGMKALFAAAEGFGPELTGTVRAYGFGSKGFGDITATTLPQSAIGDIAIRELAVADFDGDGIPDILLASHGYDAVPFPGGKSHILMQRDGQFIDESKIRLPQAAAYTHSVSAADVNGDGTIDLYMGNLCFGCTPSAIANGLATGLPGPILYLNDGTGHFTALSDGLPDFVSSMQKQYTSSRLVDVNNDGAPDLVLGSIRNVADNLLLLNDGKGHFSAAPIGSLPSKYGGLGWITVAISTADYDGDGLVDLIFVMTEGYTGRVALQLALNNGDGTFWDASEQLNFKEAPRLRSTGDYWIQWVMPIDVNGDGQMDFITSGGFNTKPRLFINQGAGYFIEMSERLPFIDAEAQIVAGDFDGDGLVDLVYISGFGNVGFAKGLKPISVSAAPPAFAPH